MTIYSIWINMNLQEINYNHNWFYWTLIDYWLLINVSIKWMELYAGYLTETITNLF